MDTRFQAVDYAGWKLEGLPARVSPHFVKDLYDRLGDKEKVQVSLSSPDFFLPEVNAQWMTFLRQFLTTLQLLSEEWQRVAAPEDRTLEPKVRGLLDKAQNNFRSVFWNEEKGFLFNLAYADSTIKDDMECETAVTAAALLGENVFDRDQLRLISQRAKRYLLQYRKLVQFGSEYLPFAMIATNSDHRIYYDDPDYHSDVVWLRSTPYLIRLLRQLGEYDTVEAILLNALDHQMSEGAILYNQELLSRPCGNNSNPDPDVSGNPVPVKNPIQFWSQWCDPFLETFEDRSAQP